MFEDSQRARAVDLVDGFARWRAYVRRLLARTRLDLVDGFAWRRAYGRTLLGSALYEIPFYSQICAGGWGWT